MIWGVVGVLMLLTGGVFAVVKYLRGAERNRAALGERNVALDLEEQRVRQMEAAAVEARKARRERLHEEAARIDSADDAAELLRRVTGADGTDDPTVN